MRKLIPLLLITPALLFACGESSDSTTRDAPASKPQQTLSLTTTTSISAEGASTPALSLGWVGDGARTIGVHNSTKHDMTAHVSLCSSGFGVSNACAPVATVVVPAASISEVAVQPSSFRIQSADTPVRVQPAAEYAIGGQSHIAAGEIRPVIADGIKLPEQTTDDALSVPELRALTASRASPAQLALTDLESAFRREYARIRAKSAVYVDDQGNRQPVTNSRAVIAARGREVLVQRGIGKMHAARTSSPAAVNKPAAVTPDASTWPSWINFQPYWTGTFYDSGFGEDKLATVGTQSAPAAGTQYQVTMLGTGAVTSGNLGPTGDVFIPYYGDGADVEVTLYSAAASVADATKQQVHVNYDIIDDDDFCYTDPSTGVQDCIYPASTPSSIGLSLTMNVAVTPMVLTPGEPPIEGISPVFAYEDDVTRVMAVLGTIYSQEDSLIPDDTTATGYHGTYVWTIHAKFSSGVPAGTVAPDVELGQNADIYSSWNSQWKYVIAHEFGHLVQADLTGGPDNGNLVYGQTTTVAACRCDEDPDSNDRGHCLQSQQQSGIAQLEAFAHFYATRTFNNAGRSYATFVDYKPSYVGGEWVNPPAAFGIGEPIDWTEYQCPSAGYGSEIDWLNFLWWETVQPNNAITPEDLHWLYYFACGRETCAVLPPTTGAPGAPVTFSALVNAANFVFAGDARAATFAQNGSTFGILDSE